MLTTDDTTRQWGLWGVNGLIDTVNETSGWFSGHQSCLPPLWPRVVCGLSFSRSQPDSEGFSPGSPVFLPPKNQLPVSYIRLGLWCSEITHGSHDGSCGCLHMRSVRSRWAGWSWKALVGSGQLSAHLHLYLHLQWYKQICIHIMKVLSQLARGKSFAYLEPQWRSETRDYQEQIQLVVVRTGLEHRISESQGKCPDHLARLNLMPHWVLGAASASSHEWWIQLGLAFVALVTMVIILMHLISLTYVVLFSLLIVVSFDTPILPTKQWEEHLKLRELVEKIRAKQKG